MNMTKKVIILDKVDSSVISQAIFILKDTPVSEFSAVAEAERIVEDYISGRLRKKHTGYLPLLLAGLILSASALILTIIF